MSNTADITWVTEQYGVRKYTNRRRAHAPHTGMALDTRWEIVRKSNGRRYSGYLTRKACLRKIARLEAQTASNHEALSPSPEARTTEL